MTPRLYIETELAAGTTAALSAEQAHYLKNVLRRAPGDEIRLFNARDGEFAATIETLRKKGGLAKISAQTRAPKAAPDIQLLFAPVKRGPVEYMIQKGTEIGAARFSPVITERTNASRLNIDRLSAIALEAAEQCDRLDIPSVDEAISLREVLENWPAGRRLIFCDEAGDDADQEWGGPDGRAAPLLEALKGINSESNPWSILIGPEGGFSSAERALIRAQDFALPVTLGPRILRADTAAIAALALWQAALGDWRRP